jgi:hypothetical protein
MRFAWHSGGEHVTFYDHPVDSDDLYHCCGGNQGTGHVMSCIVAVPPDSGGDSCCPTGGAGSTRMNCFKAEEDVFR